MFLVDSFVGNEGLADSVNHLLVVGFYLVNIGFVTLALKYGDKAADAQTGLEILSSKVHPWKYSSFSGQSPDASDTLRQTAPPSAPLRRHPAAPRA